RNRIAVPPYHLVEVWPAITFTQGGMLINSSAQVIAADGTPIPGLLAAGADTGGAFVYGYAGGLALALTSGLQAAKTAATTAAAGGMAPIQAVSGGRARFGVGRGDSAVKLLHQAPMKVAEFELYLSRLQGYLKREDVDIDGNLSSMARMYAVDPGLDVARPP